MVMSHDTIDKQPVPENVTTEWSFGMHCSWLPPSCFVWQGPIFTKLQKIQLDKFISRVTIEWGTSHNNVNLMLTCNQFMLIAILFCA